MVGFYRSGSISVEDLKAMCKKLGVPISQTDIQDLLREWVSTIIVGQNI